MKKVTKKVILEDLTVEDAGFLYEIYTHPALTVNFDESPFSPDETIEQSALKLIAACEYIFTIRPVENPNLIIGDCALHHWNKENKEIIIGGSLFPEYWGMGYMRSAFELLIEIAKQKLGIKTLLAPTKTRNTKAIRLVEKMGFIKYESDEQDTVMMKEI